MKNLPTGWWSIPGSGFKVFPGLYPYEDLRYCMSIAVESQIARRRVRGIDDTRFVR